MGTRAIAAQDSLLHAVGIDEHRSFGISLSGAGTNRFAHRLQGKCCGNSVGGEDVGIGGGGKRAAGSHQDGQNDKDVLWHRDLLCFADFASDDPFYLGSIATMQRWDEGADPHNPVPGTCGGASAGTNSCLAAKRRRLGMKIPTLGMIALVGICLAHGPAAAANFGRVTLQPGELRKIDIGPTGRSLRVCNDIASAGTVVVVIGDNTPHGLSPGLCAEDLGARMTMQSHAGGPATVDYKAICDGSDMS